MNWSVRAVAFTSFRNERSQPHLLSGMHQASSWKPMSVYFSEKRDGSQLLVSA